MSKEGGGGAETSSKRGEAIGGEDTAGSSSEEKAPDQQVQTAFGRTTSLEVGEGVATTETRAGPQDVPTVSSSVSPSPTQSAAATAEVSSKSTTSEGSSQVEAAAGSEGMTTAPRQVIAVSASKGPAAFFNLARKFLVTDEMCDLSALEGAIVSAVDAAHLLERSKLATIVRVQTSYVSVEPKRKKQQASLPDTSVTEEQQGSVPSVTSAGVSTVEPSVVSREPLVAAATRTTFPSPMKDVPRSEPQGVASIQGESQAMPRPKKSGRAKGSGAGGRELRRARIIITVKRTQEYKRWLEENPLHAITGGDDEDDPETSQEAFPRKPPP